MTEGERADRLVGKISGATDLVHSAERPNTTGWISARRERQRGTAASHTHTHTHKKNISQDVGDGSPAGGPQRDWNLSDRQWHLPPFLANFCLHVGGRFVTWTPWQRLRLRVALPWLAGVPDDAAHHLPPPAEEHHLLLLLGPGLQQRGRELLHQHGDLQHLVSEVHHLLAVHLKKMGGSSRRHAHIHIQARVHFFMHACKAHRGAAPPHCDMQTKKHSHKDSMASHSMHAYCNPDGPLSPVHQEEYNSQCDEQLFDG